MEFFFFFFFKKQPLAVGFFFIDEDNACNLKDVLIFFSGSDRVPPLGYDVSPSLVFLHHSNARFPTASTCDLQLRLPASYVDYEGFKEAMLLGIKGNNGFGCV